MKNKIENWQEEMEKCKSFEYFYNNYCKKDGMPEYSEEAYQEYLKMAEEAKYKVNRTRLGKNLHMKLYPLTPEECFTKNNTK